MSSGFPGGAGGKEPACQCRRLKRRWFPPWIGKIPWRMAHQLTPGEYHGQRNLAGYSPWGLKKLDMTGQLSMHTWKCGVFENDSLRNLKIRLGCWHTEILLYMRISGVYKDIVHGSHWLFIHDVMPSIAASLESLAPDWKPSHTIS